MPKDTLFYQKKTLNIRGRLMQLDVPVVMGIINVTPDSFYDGGKYNQEKAILERAKNMVEAGALILDVGGYSSRPGAEDVSEKEEIKRVVPAIKSIREALPDVVISVDTFRSAVARKAIEAGAQMINDISAGNLDPEILELPGAYQVPYVLMHMRGTPQNMATKTDYKDLLAQVMDHFIEKKEVLQSKGVTDIIIDPGFGFSKTVDQNFEILKNLNYFQALKCPLLVGLSRKSMIGKTLGLRSEEALNGTTVLHTLAVNHGASILRVHDVREAVETIKLMQEVNK